MPRRNDRTSARSAYRWLLGAVVLSLLALGAGGTTHFLATIAVARIAFTPGLLLRSRTL